MLAFISICGLLKVLNNVKKKLVLGWKIKQDKVRVKGDITVIRVVTELLIEVVTFDHRRE